MYSLCRAYRRRNRVRGYIAKRKRFRPSRLLQHLADRVRALPTVVGPAVDLTPTLMRKYPNAGREWVWQWMFPVRRITQAGLSCARLVVGSPYDGHERSSTMKRSSCDIGPCGVPRPSLADYVIGTGTTRGQPPPEDANVGYPPRTAIRLGLEWAMREGAARMPVMTRRISLASAAEGKGVEMKRHDPVARVLMNLAEVLNGRRPREISRFNVNLIREIH